MSKDTQQQVDFFDEGSAIRTPMQQAMRRFRANRLAIIGICVLAVLALIVLIGPFLSPYTETQMDLTSILAPPSGAHPMGTDQVGRDIMVRLFYGGRVSLSIGLTSALLAMTLGALLGALAGYYGGLIDTLLMRFTDLMLTIPTLPLLMVLGAAFKPSPTLLVGMISLFNWMATARLVRSSFLTLRTLDYAKAARAVGCRNGRIIFKHLLPNALGAIIVTATLTVGRAIISESTLSFLGVGISAPTASWGNMLQQAQSNMARAPMTAIAPGVMILLTVLAINFVGDGLDDAFDPKRGGRS